MDSCVKQTGADDENEKENGGRRIGIESAHERKNAETWDVEKEEGVIAPRKGT